MGTANARGDSRRRGSQDSGDSLSLLNSLVVALSTTLRLDSDILALFPSVVLILADTHVCLAEYLESHRAQLRLLP